MIQIVLINLLPYCLTNQTVDNNLKYYIMVVDFLQKLFLLLAQFLIKNFSNLQKLPDIFSLNSTSIVLWTFIVSALSSSQSSDCVSFFISNSSFISSSMCNRLLYDCVKSSIELAK